MEGVEDTVGGVEEDTVEVAEDQVEEDQVEETVIRAESRGIMQLPVLIKVF